MKFFYALVIINALVVVGIIGFVIWQALDSGSPMGLIILAVILLGFLGFFMYIGVPGAIVRWYIKSTGAPARAVILELRFGDLEMYSGGDQYGHGGRLTSKQAILKLEVHPNNGATYTTEDRFWVSASFVSQLTPGRELQVVIARNNPQRVVSLLETLSVVKRSNHD